MPSYLEIALRVGQPSHPASNRQKSAESWPCSIHPPVAKLREVSGAGKVASCGSPHCAGCYDVGDGTKIHPPRCGRDYLAWLNKWEAKGRKQ